MRVTSKGQVTIPKGIRDRLGIMPGSEVDFVSTVDGVRLVAIDGNISAEEKLRRFRDALARTCGTLDLGGMTSDQYFEWVRGARAEVDLG